MVLDKVLDKVGFLDESILFRPDSILNSDIKINDMLKITPQIVVEKTVKSPKSAADRSSARVPRLRGSGGAASARRSPERGTPCRLAGQNPAR